MDCTIGVVVVYEPTLQHGLPCEVLPEEPVVASGELPAVIVVNPDLPGQAVLTITRQFNGQPFSIHVITFSMQDDPALIRALNAIGIRGYTSQTSAKERLLTAVHLPRAEGLDHNGSAHNKGPLSPREVEILDHVASAKSNRQIASELGIAEGTVKRHMNNIFRKLNAVSRVDAVNKGRSLALTWAGVVPERAR